jgi:copper chaperone NosL
MEKNMKKGKVFTMMIVVFASMILTATAQPLTDIPAEGKCHVCGMFVAKYPPWITQLKSSDGKIFMFDGVKDMMAFYFEPEKYGGDATIQNVYVKDYYSLEYMDGKKAYYVNGSNVMGPMGHELIPFNSMDAAKNFMKDHHGKMVMTFDKITLEMVNAMRSGMKGHKMKHSN